MQACPLYKNPTAAPPSVPILIEDLGISPYKQKLLRMRLDGFLPKQIAHLENLTEGTINNHFAQIFHKYKSNSILDFLIKVGWVRVISKDAYSIETKGD